jgi:hypothetical protein
MKPVLRGADWGTFVPAEDHERMLELKEMGPMLKDFEGNIIKDEEGKPKKKLLAWESNKKSLYLQSTKQINSR